MAHSRFRAVLYACAVALATLSSAPSRAADSTQTSERLHQLELQNQQLQEQLRRQQELIESLSRKVNEIQETNTQRGKELENLQAEMKEPAPAAKNSGAFSLSKVSISGEGSVGFFWGGSESAYPNPEFRVDEARLFVEAPIWNNIYFFSEIDLMTPEAQNLSVQLGELYLDFENVSRLWDRDRMLNVRAGRMYIPFGEEYQTRYAIDNPLIARSITDIWGVDEGLELYGKLDKVSYVVAVQNGGPSGVADFNGDKSVAGRLSYDPARWLHLSASGMRTGDLTPPGDYWSELYFSNGWFPPSASTNTSTFHASLVEADLEFRLPRGHIKTFGGYVRYDGNDSAAGSSRDLYYYSVEVVHDLINKLYAGARFGQIFAHNGFPIAANGDMNKYFFSGTLTDEIWRLSLCLGYRWSENLILKTEYTFERGKTTDGNSRNHEDLFAIQAAFKF